MTAKSLADAEYPIAAVSKLTGVSCHALRVWERRYGFPVPHRTPAGHRRYSHDQVVILRRLSELSREGNPIGDLIAATLAGRLAVAAERPPAEGETREVPLSELLDRVQSGDLDGADVVLDEYHQRLGTAESVTRLVGPALTETGERWFRRRCSVYQEHCVSGYLRCKLETLIDAARRANAQPAHSVLLGTVQGDRHEGGVLIAHVLLECKGWRVINLGVDLPVAEYGRAVADLKPDALALSFVLSRNINKRFEELSRLVRVPVFVGGRSILNYQKLARHYGLIPVPGPADVAVVHLIREFEERSRTSRRAKPGHVTPPAPNIPT
jgi:MerR family transcriptional regulator, light-induced transcriptional regulator